MDWNGLSQEQFMARIQQQFELFERRIDAQERILARTAVSISQIWAGVEATIDTVLADKTPEERAAFRKSMNDFQQKVWSDLKQQVRDLETSGAEPSAPVGDVAGAHPSAAPHPNGVSDPPGPR